MVSERWSVVRKFVPFVEPVLSIVEGFVAKIFIHPFDQLRTGCVAPPLMRNSSEIVGKLLVYPRKLTACATDFHVSAHPSWHGSTNSKTSATLKGNILWVIGQ